MLYAYVLVRSRRCSRCTRELDNALILLGLVRILRGGLLTVEVLLLLRMLSAGRRRLELIRWFTRVVGLIFLMVLIIALCEIGLMDRLCRRVLMLQRFRLKRSVGCLGLLYRRLLRWPVIRGRRLVVR